MLFHAVFQDSKQIQTYHKISQNNRGSRGPVAQKIEYMCVFYLHWVCVWYRLRSLSHGGIEYRSHNGEFSVMSRDSSKGNAPVTMVTSVPWERERDITVVAVLAALQPSGVQYPILM